MDINVPSKVRAALYIVTGLLTPVVAVLTTQGILPDWVNVLWSAEVLFVAGLARFNVTPDK